MASIPTTPHDNNVTDSTNEIDVIKEAPLPREILSHLYSSMLKARLLARRFRTAPHNSEAVLAGALQNMEAADVIVSALPHPVLDVMLGTEISTVVASQKKSSDGVAPANLKVIAAGPDAVGGVAAGLALSLKRAQSSALVVAVVPGKLTRGAAWDQATTFAATHRLPIVFLADWTDSRTPSRKHDGRDLSHWPFPTIAVDGRDVIAVFRVTKEATSAARRGHGPTLVDCVNFLAPGGRGRDDRDPLTSFRGYLKRHNAWSDEWYKGLESQLKRELTGKSA